MRLNDLIKHAISKANETGAVKITDKPTQGDYIEHVLYVYFCILLLILLFL